jgi:hypothetical protein
MLPTQSSKTKQSLLRSTEWSGNGMIANTVGNRLNLLFLRRENGE